jgi:hypothetical protein
LFYSADHCWADLDFLEEQRQKGTPFPLPDASLGNADPALQKVLPKFYKQQMKLPRGPKSFRNALMTLEEVG